MVWIGKGEEETIRIANENIFVYRIGIVLENGIFHASCKDDELSIGETSERIKIVPKKIKKFNKIQIIEGYDCYSSYNKVGCCYVPGRTYLHIVFESSNRDDYPPSCSIGRFVIPSGTIYYMDRNGRIVSECVRYEGLVDTSKYYKDYFVYHNRTFMEWEKFKT